MPDYSNSEESEERRLAFIERRPIDPSKNMPFLHARRAHKVAAD